MNLPRTLKKIHLILYKYLYKNIKDDNGDNVGKSRAKAMLLEKNVDKRHSH